MLLIGASVKTTVDIEFAGSVLQAGNNGHITEARPGQHWGYTVQFSFDHPEFPGSLTELDFDLEEIEVLAYDICECHLLTGEMRQMSVCITCSDAGI